MMLQGVTWAYRCILLHFQYLKEVMTLLMLPYTDSDNEYITRMFPTVGQTTDCLGYLTSESVEAELCVSRPYPTAVIPSLCHTCLTDVLITLTRETSAAADYPRCECLPSQKETT